MALQLDPHAAVTRLAEPNAKGPYDGVARWNAETARWYADKYGEYVTNRLAIDALQVAPDAVVIDVGCGTGCALRRLVAKVPDGTLIGVDPVPEMMQIARERAAQHPEGHRIEWRESPAERLPFADGYADVILAFDSFDHWQDRGAGLSEVRRVLRPDGRFVVVKDRDVTGAAAARRALVERLMRAGFAVDKIVPLDEGEVSCTMWIWVVE